MAIPSALDRNLRLPLIVAPMFLVSGPELVLAACKSGVTGSLLALNQHHRRLFRLAGYDQGRARAYPVSSRAFPTLRRGNHALNVFS